MSTKATATIELAYSTTIEFDPPVLLEDLSAITRWKSDKMAVLVKRVILRDETEYTKVIYYRVKKDGSPYKDVQTATVFGREIGDLVATLGISGHYTAHHTSMRRAKQKLGLA